MKVLKAHWGSLIALGLLLLVTALLYEEWARVIVGGPRLPAGAAQLPSAAFFSLYRMLAAYLLALLFAIATGIAAASSPAASRMLLPALDVLQSVPILGFFPAAILFFVNLLHGSRLGIEMASIFLIFTSMAWNLAFVVYESLMTLPIDLKEAAAAYSLKGWERLRRLYLPACIPKLVYNTVLSWAVGWYFLIACEIIVAGPVQYTLPGLGSLLSQSASEGKLALFLAALTVLVALIVLMDTLLWRPLSRWATQHFTYEFTGSGSEEVAAFQPWWTALRRWLRIRKALRRLAWMVGWRAKRVHQDGPTTLDRLSLLIRRMRESHTVKAVWPGVKQAILIGLLILAIIVTARAGVALIRVARAPWPAEAGLIPLALAASVGRLVIAYLLSLALTLPLALWLGERPVVARVLTPAAEIVASVPATALFPLMVFFVIRLFGNMNVAAILLLMTGILPYLLFNLLAGVKALPNDLKEAGRSLGLSRWLTRRRLILPAIVPSLITGSLTAWGGGWNTLILAEYFVYQRETYTVLGVGALLSRATYVMGNGTLVLLVIAAMVMVVVVTNRFFWQRLYAVAADRFRLEY